MSRRASSLGRSMSSSTAASPRRRSTRVVKGAEVALLPLSCNMDTVCWSLKFLSIGREERFCFLFVTGGRISPRAAKERITEMENPYSVRRYQPGDIEEVLKIERASFGADAWDR